MTNSSQDRSQRLQAILHAYMQAVDRGESPDRQVLLDAHPELRVELAEYFADASKLEALAKSLKTATFGGERRGVNSWEAPAPEAIAAQFPEFAILDLLGQGGMGAVYKARQIGLDRLVALKILPGDKGRDPAFTERFTREAKALARLSHPSIVAVYDVGQTAEGLCYFVMEFIDGVNLRQALQRGTISPKEALAIVPQICDALQFAHDEGVVHRDIKPENILLDRKGRVKIADFGLAKLTASGDGEVPNSLTGTHQVMGTLRYMAPEQMEGSKQVDHRADIYSLGVVFYELLTGEVPMGRFAPPSKKVRIDVRLDEVVLRALEREPEHRWQQAGEVKTEVEAISSGPIDSPRAAMDRKVASMTFPFQTMPRDGADLRFALLAAPWIYLLYFVPPCLFFYVLFLLLGFDWFVGGLLGLVVGLGVFLAISMVLLLGSIRSAVLEARGIAFHRYLGPSRFLSWKQIRNIAPIKKWEVFRQVWLWPGLPPRGSIVAMSAQHYYRIDTPNGSWYFCPQDPDAFLDALRKRCPSAFAPVRSIEGSPTARKVRPPRYDSASPRVVPAYALAFVLTAAVFGLVCATVGFAEAATWGSLTWLAVHGFLLLWLPRGAARTALWTSWTLACVAVYFTLWMPDVPATSWWCRGLGYIDRHYWPYEGKSKCSVTLTPKDKTFRRVTITNEREIRRNGYGSRGVVNWSGPGWAGERTRDDYSMHLERLPGEIALLDINTKGFVRRWAGTVFTWKHDRALTTSDLVELVVQVPMQPGKLEEMKAEQIEVLSKQAESLLRLMRTAQSDDDASGGWKGDSRPVGYLAFFVGRDDLEASLKSTPFYWEDYVGTHEYSFKPTVSILYVGVPVMVAVWLAGILFVIRSRLAFWCVLLLFLLSAAAAAFGIAAVSTGSGFELIPRETKAVEAPNKAENPPKSRRPDPPPLPPPPPNLDGPPATETLDLGNGVKLDLVLIPAGTFIMGAAPGEDQHMKRGVDTSWEVPAHPVTIARPFYMGKFEVTQAQWLAVMGKAPRSRVTLEAEKDPKKFGNYPIEDINLQETLDFCVKSSQMTKRTVRLPSEAEWEYACRAGTKSYYFFGNSMQRDLGNGELESVVSQFMKDNVVEPYEVGKHKPNPWGLYDIIGNVAERCADTTTARNYKGAPTDGSPWMAEGKPVANVIRGTWDPRSAARTAFQSENFHSKTLGMRVVVEIDQPRKVR